MLDFNTNTKNDETWLTPPGIVKALGPFDLDPCCPENMPWQTATHMYTKKDDGLSKQWEGRVWLNPPYGRQTFLWLEKLAAHGNGIAIIFARTETRGFHNTIWNKASALLFFKGRISFYRVDGTKSGPANAPSCLVAYGKNNVSALWHAWENCKDVDGKIIELSDF